MRFRPDKAMVRLFDAGVICMALVVPCFIVAMVGGDSVQTTLYYILSLLAHIFLLIFAAELACMCWVLARLFSLNPVNFRPMFARFVMRTAVAIVLFVIITYTRLIVVAPLGGLVFHVPVIAPAVTVAARTWALTPAQAEGAGTIFYAAVALIWISVAVLPLAVRSAVTRHN